MAYEDSPRVAKPPTYWSRWKAYGRSCAGHTLQGFLIGLLILAPILGAAYQQTLGDALAIGLLLLPMPVFGFTLALAYIAYQAGSGARKALNSNQHRTDSIGLDIADLTVGLWLSLVVSAIVLFITM